MPMPFGDGEIDLSNIPTQGGGGGVTNTYNSSAPVAAPVTRLFVGWQKKQMPTRAMGSGGLGLDETDPHSGRVPVYKTIFQMLQAFDAFSTAEYQKFKNKLVAAGIVSSDASSAYIRSKYETLLNDVLAAQDQNVNVTPFGFVNSLIKKNGIDPSKVPAKANWDPTSSAAGFQPSTQKVTSVYDMDPAQAEVMLTQTLQRALGRDPSKAEIEDFVDAVKSRALQDPTTQVTQMRRGDRSNLADANTQVSVTTQGGKSFSQIQTVNDGFTADDAALLAQKRAEAAPDYASAQAVSTYFPAFLQALGSTV